MSYLSIFDLKKYKKTREEKMRRENKYKRRNIKFMSNQTMKMRLIVLFFTHFLSSSFHFIHLLSNHPPTKHTIVDLFFC